MKRKIKAVIITVTVVVLVFNIPILHFVPLSILDKGRIRYSNADGSFTHIERFELLSGMLTNEDRSREETEEVYRLYRLNPFCFWRWSFYLLVSKDFRYKNWEKDIEPNRVPYDPKNTGQDF